MFFDLYPSGGGFVEDRTPLFREESLTPDKPADHIIEKSGTYPFTTTAEYKGVKGKATVIVLAIIKCSDEEAAYQEAVEELKKAFEKKEILDQEADLLLLLIPIICIKDPLSCKDAIDNFNKKIDEVIEAKKAYKDARDKAKKLYKIWQDCLKGK